MSNPRAVTGNNTAYLEGELDAFAHSLLALNMAIETRFDGDLSFVGMTWEKALKHFLEEVKTAGGPAGADRYARILIKALQPFVLEKKP